MFKFQVHGLVECLLPRTKHNLYFYYFCRCFIKIIDWKNFSRAIVARRISHLIIIIFWHELVENILPPLTCCALLSLIKNLKIIHMWIFDTLFRVHKLVTQSLLIILTTQYYVFFSYAHGYVEVIVTAKLQFWAFVKIVWKKFSHFKPFGAMHSLLSRYIMLKALLHRDGNEKLFFRDSFINSLAKS